MRTLLIIIATLASMLGTLGAAQAQNAAAGGSIPVEAGMSGPVSYCCGYTFYGRYTDP